MDRSVLLPAAMGCLCAVLASPRASIAAPAITSLNPPGGERGTTIEVFATGTFDKWPVHVWSSDKSVTVAALADKGKFRVTVAKDATPGICWFRCYDETGASAPRPFVVGTLPEVAEVEPNDEPAKAQPIDKSVVVNGKLAKSGDVDCYAVKLKKGQTLVADLVARRVLRSPMDAVLQIVASNGSVLEQNNDYCDLDPRIAFTAPRDGTYTVRLFAFPAQPDSGIRYFGSDACIYRLTLSTSEFVDFVTPLAVERKSAQKVTLHGWNLSAATRELSASEEPFSVVPNTTVPVRREPHSCYDFTQSKPDAPLTIPFSVTGILNRPNSTDTIAFKGFKGKPVAIQLESPSLHLWLTPVLRILDDANKQLARVEAASLNTDLETTLTPSADGTFRIEVRDLLNQGGPRHAYRLRVVPVAPDFSLTVASDRFTVAPDKPLDIAVAVNRKNGFANDIEFTVEGLPTDVTVTPPAKSEKSNAKTSNVRLTAKKPGVSGSIRIVGKSKDEPALQRTASANVAEFDTTTSDLWLTVSGTKEKK